MILVPLLKQTLTTGNLLIILATIFVGLLSHYCYRYKKYRRGYGDIPTFDAEFFLLKKYFRGGFDIDITAGKNVFCFYSFKLRDKIKFEI